MGASMSAEKTNTDAEKQFLEAAFMDNEDVNCTNIRISTNY
jgi:hypothetical protein